MYCSLFTRPPLQDAYNFISDFISSIGRDACESTKESYGDKCPHDVNVGGNVYNPGGEPKSNVRGTEY